MLNKKLTTPPKKPTSANPGKNQIKTSPSKKFFFKKKNLFPPIIPLQNPLPFFSVIIPTYNRPQAVIKAVNSVLNQTFSSFECIVIDDGSLSPTTFPNSFWKKKQLLYHYFPQNQGVSWARNKGILLSKANWIALLDSDDQYLPTKLQRHFELIQEKNQTLFFQSEEYWIRNGKQVNPPKYLLKKEGNLFFDSLKRCSITPSSAIIHKSLFKRYGMFNQKLPACEDYDLWIRFTANEKVGLLKEKLLIRYGGHKDQLSFKYPAMDRFRIQALADALLSNKNPLQRPAIQKMFLKKNYYLRQGAKKRKRYRFWLFLLTWALSIKLQKLLETLKLINP